MQKIIKNKIIQIGVIVAVLILGGAYFYKLNYLGSKASENSLDESASYPEVQVIKIGDVSTSTKELNLESGISWFGEIISPKNGNVQAKRDGSIASWNVSIGQNVYAGQVLGRLSPPSRTPDVVQAIAGQSEGLAKAQAEYKASLDFTTKKIEQLKSLKTQYEAGGQADSLANSNRQNIKSVLSGSLSKLIPQMFTGGSINNTFSITQNNLIMSVGITDSNMRNQYADKVVNMVKALKNNDPELENFGREYFDSTVKILSSSIDVSDGNTSIPLLKTSTTEEQQKFLTAISDYKNVSISNTDKILDIESQIIELEKELALKDAELTGKKASYNTVVGGLLGGLEIVAPRSGTVSTINKNVGEYVTPQDVLAFILSSDKSEKLVRFKIPSNSIKPEHDQELSVVRPGYLDTKLKIKVVGIGNSLDPSGSFLADGKFVENVDWPINSQVRVLNDSSKSTTATIPFSAIFFGEDGDTAVWTVTSENTLKAKDVKTGRTFGDNVEIEKGLLVGDVVVTKPIEKMVEGMAVSSSVSGAPQIQSDKKSGGTKDESQPHSHDE